MLGSIYGHVESYYGNIQAGYSIPQPYKWGAWPVKKRYQPPLKAHEEKRIESPVEPKERSYDHATAARLRHEAAARQPKRAAEPAIGRRPRYVTDDDEAYFILMH